MNGFSRLMGAPLVLVACAALTNGTTAASKVEPQEKPATCLLSPHAYKNRITEIEQLLAGSDSTRELDDGYEFRFPGDKVWATRLVDLIQAERQCCEFFTFELSFEPQRGSIWLRVRGSGEVKKMLGAMLAD